MDFRSVVEAAKLWGVSERSVRNYCAEGRGADAVRVDDVVEILKLYYYRGLQNRETERGYLRDVCLTAQDAFREALKYFRIECCGRRRP